MTAAPQGYGTSALDFLFHPESIAIVGLSTDPSKAWLSDCYVTPMLQMGYPGSLYVVNPKGGHIDGVSVYPSVKDIPGTIDYVISLVPAQHTPRLLEECAAKGVRAVQFYTAGFSETGEPDDVQLQERLVSVARRLGMRLLGPNCMGLYCPESRLGFCPDFPSETGSIGLLCQSGGNTGYIVRSAAARGLRFSKVISYGNACDINECELLEYLANDDATRVITAYIEGTTDGRQLLRSLSMAARRKPVIVLKGGETESGRRAAATHTGSLAGVDAVWDSLLKQAGALRVDSVEEMADVLVAMLQMRRPRGLNTCVIGIGGGSNVLATDDCEHAGLRLAPFPPHIAERVSAVLPPAGSMRRNPLDAFSLVGFPQGWQQLVDILHDWEGLDLVLFHYAFGGPPLPPHYERIAPALGPMTSAAKNVRLPMAVVLHSTPNNDSWQASLTVQRMCLEAGLPFFVSVSGAALAIRKVVEFGLANPGLLDRLLAEA